MRLQHQALPAHVKLPPCPQQVQDRPQHHPGRDDPTRLRPQTGRHPRPHQLHPVSEREVCQRF